MCEVSELTDAELIQRCRDDPAWAAAEITRLIAKADKIQDDLNQAVGYRIAVKAMTRGDWDREDREHV